MSCLSPGLVLSPHSPSASLSHLCLSWEQCPSSPSLATGESCPCSQGAGSLQARSPRWECPGCERSGRADRSQSPLETGPSWSSGGRKEKASSHLSISCVPYFLLQATLCPSRCKQLHRPGQLQCSDSARQWLGTSQVSECSSPAPLHRSVPP